MAWITKLLLPPVMFLLGAVLPTSGYSQEQFRSVSGPCNFHFPRDHGPHQDFRTEWWYYTGRLESEQGHEFGFQLTFFRSRVTPPATVKHPPEPPSAWRTDQLYLAHAALTDIPGQDFFHAEQMARAALGMAGASREGDGTGIFLKHWYARIEPHIHKLSAETDDFSVQLTLKPAKPPVPHGNSGYSLKGRKKESASCYYSMTRLQATGSVFLQHEEYPVKGLAWMDHEFSSAPLEADLVGWDWFSLQFNDNTELMIYLLRQDDGEYSPASSGTFVEPAGQVQHLSREMIEVEVLEVWESPRSAAIYPAQWRIRIKPLDLELIVLPTLADQEMLTPESTRVTYWEGSVSANGSIEGNALHGVGYVELTGYAKKFDAPM